MRNRIQGLLVSVLGLASAALFALAGASCDSAAIQCVAGHGPFIAKYEVKAGSSSTCLDNFAGFPVLGEEIGLSTYLAPNSDGTLADYNKRKIAIQSGTLGGTLQSFGLGDTAREKAYALGDYTTDPDANNLCYAGGANGTAALAMADLDIPATDDGMGGMTPAIHLQQEWSNIKVYVTADVPGTQMVGEMVFRDVIAGCTSEYKVIGLFPAHFCGVEVHVDDDNDPSTPSENDDADPDNDDTPNLEPSDDECSPDADPSKGRVFGSGINPDFAVQCDPALFYCTLTTPPLTGNP